jgi:hypothetical protein
VSTLSLFKRRPTGEEIAKDHGVFIGKPLQRLRVIVFQGTGQSIGQPDLIAEEATALLHELLQGAHGGALRH